MHPNGWSAGRKRVRLLSLRTGVILASNVAPLATPGEGSAAGPIALAGEACPVKPAGDPLTKAAVWGGTTMPRLAQSHRKVGALRPDGTGMSSNVEAGWYGAHPRPHPNEALQCLMRHSCTICR